MSSNSNLDLIKEFFGVKDYEELIKCMKDDILPFLRESKPLDEKNDNKDDSRSCT